MHLDEDPVVGRGGLLGEGALRDAEGGERVGEVAGRGPSRVNGSG